MKVLRQSAGLAFCAFLLSMGQAAAEYCFDVWTADSGLPQNTVRAILQSRDGYLWVATLDGFARFDGVRFTVFKKANSPGLPGNRITTLYEDRDDALWIGLEDGRVARYHEGRFASFGLDQGLPAGPVQSISGDEQGHLWVGARNTLLRLGEGRFRTDLPEDATAMFAGSGVHGERYGVTWTTNQEGLHVVSHGRLTTFNSSNGLPSLRINQVDSDQHGSWWVATDDAGLLKIQHGKVVKAYTQGEGLPANRVRTSQGRISAALACEDRKGNLWVNGAGPWLGRLKDGVFTAYPSALARSSHPLPSAPGLPGGHITALFEDREGNLWIGTEGSGLIRAREQVVNALSTPHGLHSANIYPIYEDRTGAVWLGTWERGLARVQAGVVSNFVSELLHAVTALCEDRAGRLWIGTIGGPIIFQDGRMSQSEIPEGLRRQIVSAMCQDRSGALWFGAEHALFRYQNGELSSFQEGEGLAGEFLSVIIEDRAGALWIGGFGGLMRLANGRFTSWTERDGLPSNHVRALYEDGDGTLWIGTYDGGLGRFKEGRFTRYTTREGMFDDGVFQILEDARGNFWMSSNRGIHRVGKRELNEFADGHRRTITAVSYGKSDGMLNVECNGGRWPGGVKTRDGKLWFPTQDGVAVIDPAALPINTKAPPVAIEAFVLEREPQSLQRPVRVPPGKANIEIQFTGLSLVNSERLAFKYRLAGADADWVEAGNRRAAYYSHLAPGRYTFTVLAANSDGVWNSQGASLAFTVEPKLWQTAWFRIAALVLLAGMAFAFYRARILHLERRQAAQHAFARGLIQSQELERKRIAAELHDSLGQNLLVIKNRAVMGKNPGASAGHELDEIARLATQSIEEVREISQNLRPYQLDRLGLTRALHGLVKKVGTSAALKCTVDIMPLDRVFSAEAEVNFFRIVQEALNNVLKHSGASEARVVVERDDARVQLRVEDNGKGFDARANHHSESAHGMGLSGIAERVRILHGQMAIDSAPGQGTRLNVDVPIPKEIR